MNQEETREKTAKNQNKMIENEIAKKQRDK